MGINTPTSKRLKAWRKAKDLSQSEAAKELGASVRTLQNWEIGRNEPKGLALTALNELTSTRRKPTPPKSQQPTTSEK